MSSTGERTEVAILIYPISIRSVLGGNENFSVAGLKSTPRSMPPCSIVLHTFAELLRQVERQQKNKSENAVPDILYVQMRLRGANLKGFSLSHGGEIKRPQALQSKA